MKSLSSDPDLRFFGCRVHDTKHESTVRYQQAVVPGPYREETKLYRSGRSESSVVILVVSSRHCRFGEGNRELDVSSSKLDKSLKKLKCQCTDGEEIKIDSLQETRVRDQTDFVAMPAHRDLDSGTTPGKRKHQPRVNL